MLIQQVNINSNTYSQSKISFKAKETENPDLKKLRAEIQQMAGTTEEEVIQLKAPKEPFTKKIKKFYASAKKGYKAIIIAAIAILSFVGGYFLRPIFIQGERYIIEKLGDDINSQKNELDSINTKVALGYEQIDALDSTYIAKIQDFETRLTEIMEKTQGPEVNDSTLIAEKQEIFELASDLQTKENQDTTINAIKSSAEYAQMNKVENLKQLPANKDGWTEVHYWCKDCNYAAVKNFIDTHPDFDVNQRTNSGKSYIYLARKSSSTFGKDLIDLLASVKSLDLSITDKDGWNDLHYLCYRGYTGAVQNIVNNNPNLDVNQRTQKGKSYIDLALEGGHRDIVNILAGIKSLDLSITNEDGFNDLHSLCNAASEYPEAVVKILDNHPDLDMDKRTKKGKSYLDLARRSSNKTTVALLSQRL